jgi:tetratricopeptide (TPR) repeat protein
MQLVRAYNDGILGSHDGESLAYVAMAAAMLDSPHDANDAFRESVCASPDRVETYLEWAALFLSKHDAGHAEECLRDALRRSPEHPIAHAMMARIRLEHSWDFAAASEDRAVAVAPNLVMAHVTRAAMALRDLDLASADAHLDAAFAIDPHDLEALSMRAAARLLAEDPRGFREAVRRVLDLHPRDSTLFGIVAEYAEWEHRYPEIVELAREALQIDPDDARAYATLGRTLLRMGREEEGLAALHEACRRDRFDVRVDNTLNFWDEVVRRHYETFEARPFVFRLHREERPLLEGALTNTLRAAGEDMRRR